VTSLSFVISLLGNQWVSSVSLPVPNLRKIYTREVGRFHVPESLRFCGSCNPGYRPTYPARSSDASCGTSVGDCVAYCGGSPLCGLPAAESRRSASTPPTPRGAEGPFSVGFFCVRFVFSPRSSLTMKGGWAGAKVASASEEPGCARRTPATSRRYGGERPHPRGGDGHDRSCR
jgi:hypothetical protein